MAEYRCGDCGVWFRGVPFDRLVDVSRHHKTECEGQRPATPEEAGRG